MTLLRWLYLVNLVLNLGLIVLFAGRGDTLLVILYAACACLWAGCLALSVLL